MIELAAPTSTSFTLQAVPQNGQTADTLCSTLSITDTELLGATGTSGADACWN